MKAAYFRGEGVIEFVEVDRPQPGPDELLIRVAANGLCGSDHKALEGGHATIPGHEVVGRVVARGPDCETEVGTRVAAYIPLYCGTCRFCQQGAENLCQHKAGLLGWGTDGGYAEFMRLPDRNALELDDRISFGEGVLLLDTLGTSGHALRLAHCWESESALVIGAGPIGLGAVVILKAFGVPTVYVSEIATYRLEAAAALGAIPVDPTSESLADRIRVDYPYGVDLVVEAVGSWPTIQSSLDLVRPGGTINLVGEHWGRIELERPKGAWMINDLTLIRSFYFPISEFEENQQMILDGTLDVASIASHTFPLEDLDAAYELFSAGQALKVLVTP